MTTEEDWEREINKARDSWQTLLVFADWLEERRDPRARAYRVIAARRMVPGLIAGVGGWWYSPLAVSLHIGTTAIVPKKWFVKMVQVEEREKSVIGGKAARTRALASQGYYYTTAYKAFQGLALGFLAMPLSEQAKYTPKTDSLPGGSL